MPKHKILILGKHPISENLIRQYKALGGDVKHQCELKPIELDINAYDELCLLTNPSSTPKTDADFQMIEVLKQIATRYDKLQHEGRKLRCHLLLQSAVTLQMLRETDFCDEIRSQVDVYPFTMDDVWSRSIVLDYEPITIQSERTVHLVIFGMDEISEAVAINAAHVAHYPNFTRMSSLRTRITVIDERATQKSEQWIQRHRHLFDNSYYRLVTPRAKQVVQHFHHPLYLSRGMKDFVDIEWEFVEASIFDRLVREKLQLWASDHSRQLLSIVFAHDDEEQNLNEAHNLPDSVYGTTVPLYVYMRNATLLQVLRTPARWHFHPFGMINEGYDVLMPFVQMAKTVNYIYNKCYHDNIENWTGSLRYTVEIDRNVRETMWQKVSAVKRMSNIYNAMSIPTKMRSVGLLDDEWDKFYDISQQDIEILAEVEHNRWNVEELILGWRPCTAEEQRLVEGDIRQKEELKKIKVHYDLRAYDDLRSDATGKPVALYDLCLCSCLPLIAKSFAEEKGGGL